VSELRASGGDALQFQEMYIWPRQSTCCSTSQQVPAMESH